MTIQSLFQLVTEKPVKFICLIMLISVYLFLFKKKVIFGCAESSLLCGLSLVVTSGGYSLVFITVNSLVAEYGLGCTGFSSCGPRA